MPKWSSKLMDAEVSNEEVISYSDYVINREKVYDSYEKSLVALQECFRRGYTDCFPISNLQDAVNGNESVYSFTGRRIYDCTGKTDAFLKPLFRKVLEFERRLLLMGFRAPIKEWGVYVYEIDICDSDREKKISGVEKMFSVYGRSLKAVFTVANCLVSKEVKSGYDTLRFAYLRFERCLDGKR